MKALWVGAVLLACSCATFKTERFPIDGRADELQASALEASDKLGWTTEAAEGGGFRITGYPRQHWLMKKPLLVTVKDGELAVEGETVTGGWPQGGTVEAGRLLASATKQVRGEAVFAPPIEERSEAITVALDLVSPAAGAWYALKGDPAYDQGLGQRNFWAEFFMRAGIDVLCGAFALEIGLFRLRDGSSVFPQWMIAMPLAILVSTRISALMNDLLELPFRNAYARSGLRGPGG